MGKKHRASGAHLELGSYKFFTTKIDAAGRRRALGSTTAGHTAGAASQADLR